MAAQAHDTMTTVRPARRTDAGAIRLSQRDIDGLLMCGEYCRTGYAATGRPGPGPGWCWLTRAVASFPAGEQVRVVVRELPAAAFAPEPQR